MASLRRVGLVKRAEPYSSESVSFPGALLAAFSPDRYDEVSHNQDEIEDDGPRYGVVAEKGSDDDDEYAELSYEHHALPQGRPTPPLGHGPSMAKV